MKREVALSFTIDLINELNTDVYKLEDFEDDSIVLMKLLSILDMTHLEENLDDVFKKCDAELRKSNIPCNTRLRKSDKKAILRYL